MILSAPTRRINSYTGSFLASVFLARIFRAAEYSPEHVEGFSEVVEKRGVARAVRRPVGGPLIQIDRTTMFSLTALSVPELYRA